MTGMDTDMDKATPTADRIEALDVVRGVALFGILLMNITGMGLPNAYSDPTVYGGATGANLWAWIIIQMGFEGTQRGLFSMLFGAGVILFTTRLDAAGRRDTADIYFRRNLWLIGFGMINGWVLLWAGDILYAYGITALFVFSFRKLAPRALLVIGVATLVAGGAWSLKETRALIVSHDAAQAATAATRSGAKPTPAQKTAIDAWQKSVSDAKPDAKTLAAEVSAMRGGYRSAMMHVGEDNLLAQSWYLYRYFFDIFGMMLIGMGLFKLGVLTLERPAATYVMMMLAGYALGLGVNFLETRWVVEHGFSVIAFSQSNITYDLGRLAMTIGHLGALLLFCRSGALPWLRRALAAVGRMALTNYLTHSLVALILFVGLGWFGLLQRYQLYGIVFTIWAVQLIGSPLWLSRYRFGPIEWLWRYLTYGRREPLRRRGGAMAATA